MAQTLSLLNGQFQKYCPLQEWDEALWLVCCWVTLTFCSTLTKYWTQFPCQSTSATYFQIILNITSVRTCPRIPFHLKLLLDFHFEGSQWEIGLFKKCRLRLMALAGCCCYRNSVLELGSIPVPAHLCSILHGRAELCTILPLRDARQHFQSTVGNNLNQRECFPLHCNSHRSVGVIPARLEPPGRCSSPAVLSMSCNAGFAPGPPFLSYLKWPHCRPGRIKAVLCSLSDFISVQFHLWALHLQAEWSNSPNFLLGITLTTHLRPRGYLK